MKNSNLKLAASRNASCACLRHQLKARLAEGNRSNPSDCTFRLIRAIGGKALAEIDQPLVKRIMAKLDDD
jgi:hypothetical protein